MTITQRLVKNYQLLILILALTGWLATGTVLAYLVYELFSSKIVCAPPEGML